MNQAKPMKRRRLWIILMVIAGVVVAGWSLGRREVLPDRVYKGKKVSEWVAACVEKEDHTFAENRDPDFQLLREIRDDALPHLIQIVKNKPAFVNRKFYKSIYYKLPVAIRSRLPIPKDGSLIRVRAFWALDALNPPAETYVPVLIQQFNTNNTELDFVRNSLTKLGPAAKEAIPTLTNALHGPDGMLRWDAGRILAKVYPDCPELLPAVMKDLKSTHVITRRFAGLVLSDLGQIAKPAIPALKEALNDPDATVRSRAAEALKEIGPQ